MSDIVERLRNDRYASWLAIVPMCVEAADEIERLRAQVDRLTREITEADGAVLRARNEHKQAEARAERLRAECEALRKDADRYNRMGRWVDTNLRRLVALHKGGNFYSEFYDSVSRQLALLDAALREAK